MVKFNKNKFKALNKIAKKQKEVTNNVTNKILKKKINAEKKVSFQKEVLLKEAAKGHNPLVQNIGKINLLEDLSKKTVKRKEKPEKSAPTPKPKLKPIEKQRKRQKTQISDTKLLLKLMNKKK